jgi:23S rRNA (cytidine2498-2'-O)-methyltransferase
VPPGPPDGFLHVHLTAPGFEPSLLRELGERRATGPRWPCVVSHPREASSPTEPPADPVFSLQQLPAARLVQGDSVMRLAEDALATVDAVLDAGERPIALHALVPDARAYRSVAGRAALIGEAFLSVVRARRRRTSRRIVAAGEATAAIQAGEALVIQMVLVGRRSLLVDATVPRPVPGGGRDVMPWPGGHAPVPEDRVAPSRAYRKLVEGLGWLGAGPGSGQRCVDLGGAPGGWAWTALSRGAQVTAVDRSPLAPPALGHPALRMITGDAFTHVPPAPVDWLLCDVICEPARTVALVERWLRDRLARNVVATLKFKGGPDLAVVADARRRLGALGCTFLRIKHLQHHHNEAAILARLS